MTNETVVYEGGPMHNKFEVVPPNTASMKFVMMSELQPTDGPVQVEDVFYTRTRRTKNGMRVYRMVAR